MARRQDSVLTDLGVKLAQLVLHEALLWSRLVRASNRMQKCRKQIARLKKRIRDREEELKKPREEAKAP